MSICSGIIDDQLSSTYEVEKKYLRHILKNDSNVGDINYIYQKKLGYRLCKQYNLLQKLAIDPLTLLHRITLNITFTENMKKPILAIRACPVFIVFVYSE